MSARKFSIVVPALFILGGVFLVPFGTKPSTGQTAKKATTKQTYAYPSFYKGFYLTSGSGNNRAKLERHITRAKKAGLNAVVIDVQTPGMRVAVTPAEHVAYCRAMGFHPIARVVVFPEGLSEYPAAAELIENRLAVAEAACRAGYREIQFDYIRFNDHRVNRALSLAERYEYITGFLKKARERLSKYDVRIAADIFGRIPLNADDKIGQKMELLDGLVDVICPMAYPSHYTWSKKMMADPYYTVHITSKRALERAPRSAIVTWIQAFRMKVKRSKLGYDRYVAAQIKAVHDSGAGGYLLWNAAQDYAIPLAVAGEINRRRARVASLSETPSGGN